MIINKLTMNEETENKKTTTSYISFFHGSNNYSDKLKLQG